MPLCQTCHGRAALWNPQRPTASPSPCPDCNGTGKVAENVHTIAPPETADENLNIGANAAHIESMTRLGAQHEPTPPTEPEAKLIEGDPAPTQEVPDTEGGGTKLVTYPAPKPGEVLDGPPKSAPEIRAERGDVTGRGPEPFRNVDDPLMASAVVGEPSTIEPKPNEPEE